MFFFQKYETMLYFVVSSSSIIAGVAQWVYARLMSERPQMQVQSLLEAPLRSLKQSPIDDNCLR